MKYNSGRFKKGHIISEETRRKISIANKGKKMSDESRKKVSVAKTGKKRSEEFKQKMRIAMTGRKFTEEHRKKISEANKGEKCYLWKGGISPLGKILRGSVEYKLWRESVFARDKWTCRWCGVRGGILHPHHIKPFSHYPELRFAIDNGLTLCVDCHKTTETYGGKMNNFKKSI